MEKFLCRFGVPAVARRVIDQIVRPEEIAFVEALEAEGSFAAPAANRALTTGTGKVVGGKETDRFLREAYRRGILQLEDESFTRFRLGSFYGRLDIFAITEPDVYQALPREQRAALDDWYFGAYLAGLAQTPRPSEDRVALLSEALAFLDEADAAGRKIWLNRCDCRTLAGHCGKPTDTCISFRSGINTLSHRGWSKLITKEEAKEVLRRANRAGLMQTVNPNGICNCCGDCCYLFRAQNARNDRQWPAAGHIAGFDSKICVSCGLCAKRCPFGAFSAADGVGFDPALCRGCGLCAETCPVGAIQMKRRACL